MTKLYFVPHWLTLGAREFLFHSRLQSQLRYKNTGTQGTIVSTLQQSHTSYQVTKRQQCMLKHALRGKPGYHNFRVLSFCSSSYFCQHATHFLLKKKLFDLLKSTLIIHARTPTYTLHVRDKNPISYSYVNSLATHPACALHCISYATLETFLIFLYI